MRLYMSGKPTVWQASKFNLGLNVRTMFAPGKRFSVAFEEDLYRLAEPTNFEAARAFNFNRIDNSLALRFTLRPSGGRISLDVAYRNELLYFLSNELPDTSDRVVNGIETETKYRFRDRSAFAVRYSFHYTTYFCCVETGTGRNEDSQAHRVLAGYVGQLGKKVVLDAFAGYGWGLYKQDVSGPNHKNFIGYAALGWFPGAKTQVGFHIGRSFHDSLWGNYYTDTGGSIAGTHVFRWNMRLDAGIGVYRRRYAGIPIPGVDTQDIVGYAAADGFLRKDTLISFNLQLEQALGNLVLNAIRYNHEGGHVAVVLEQAGEGFSLRVIDDGPGIPEADRRRLMARGARGDAARTREPRGQGLGLAIVFRVA
ncbi:MAG: sensor histidine kinase, partial [Myxococcales bacterium]|nr:sensor histidine kinase [Myxococcales bacterium]